VFLFLFDFIGISFSFICWASQHLVNTWHWPPPAAVRAVGVSGDGMVASHYHTCCCWRSLKMYDCHFYSNKS
jgi:hypothetical protein